ncbi:hypothetical protein RJ640_002053, partial [Escallonia rubra]
MHMRASNEGAFDPIAPLALPNSLHVFHRLSSTDTMNMEGRHTYCGGFWNYFSMGKGIEWMLKYHMHFSNSGNYTQRDLKTKYVGNDRVSTRI